MEFMGLKAVVPTLAPRHASWNLREAGFIYLPDELWRWVHIQA